MYTIQDLTSIVHETVKDTPVTKVILVGSYAKGTATDESDIDLILDGDDLSEAYWDILFALEDKLTVPVDVMTMHGLKNSVIRDSVLDGGVTLYETLLFNG